MQLESGEMFRHALLGLTNLAHGCDELEQELWVVTLLVGMIIRESSTSQLLAAKLLLLLTDGAARVETVHPDIIVGLLRCASVTAAGQTL